MRFQKILRDQIGQTVDLLEIFICLLVPVLLVKGMIDFISQRQVFWLRDIILFLKSVVGFIALSIPCDLFEAVHRYRSR
ncbi:hypothetical protein KB236_09820 [Levilactobacillus brevis]|nr:hypothetical protein KB236_09820 [Levilactobacillus brevis]